MHKSSQTLNEQANKISNVGLVCTIREATVELMHRENVNHHHYTNQFKSDQNCSTTLKFIDFTKQRLASAALSGVSQCRKKGPGEPPTPFYRLCTLSLCPNARLFVYFPSSLREKSEKL